MGRKLIPDANTFRVVVASVIMGQFPYSCEICGGGYDRCALRDMCGQEAHEDCEGGQFCWEDEVICELVRVVIGDTAAEDAAKYRDLKEEFDRGLIFDARYMGYGNFESEALPDIIIYSETEIDSATEANYLIVKVRCVSCYRKNT